MKWLAKLTRLSCADLPSSTKKHKAVLLSIDASRTIIQGRGWCEWKCLELGSGGTGRSKSTR